MHKSRHGTHKIHLIPRPNRRAMGCVLWGFGRNRPHYNGTALYIATPRWSSLIVSYFTYCIILMNIDIIAFLSYQHCTGQFPTQRPMTQNFDVFFDMRLNKRWSKQSWGRWFDTPSRPLWRHCNGFKSLWWRHMSATAWQTTINSTFCSKPWWG